MAGIKISALPAISVPLTTDIFPVVQSGVTYKETVTQLSTLLGTTITSLTALTGYLVFPSGVKDTFGTVVLDWVTIGALADTSLRFSNSTAPTSPSMFVQSPGNAGITFLSAGTGTFQFTQGATNTTNPVQFSPNGAAGSKAIFTWGTLTGNRTYTFQDASGTVAHTSLAGGGTNAALTASNGGIVWSNSTQLQILAGTATANQVLLSGSSATPAWSTATYPPTTVINQLLFSSATNTIAGLTTANGGVLVTSNTGVPSILAGSGTTGTVLQATAAGTPAWSTVTYPVAPGWTTWTNTLNSAGTLPTFSTNNARFQKVGNVVFCEVFMNNTAGGTAGAGNNAITMNLPVTAGATQSTAIAICGFWANNSVTNALGVQIASNGATVATLLKGLTGGGTQTALQCADLADANNRLISFKFSYEI